MIISVMDNSMAASVWLDDDDVLSWGVMGGVDDLPPGYSMPTLLYMGNEGVGQVGSQVLLFVVVCLVLCLFCLCQRNPIL